MLRAHPVKRGAVSPRTVLLVEDDPVQSTLAMRAFKLHGITDHVDEIVLARDGVEALDYLFGRGKYAGRDTRVMPEFVLLDVNLPKVDGITVLERLRNDKRTELLPVILFSSSNNKRVLLDGYRAGANSYVTKPTDFDKFLEAIRHLGWYWLDWNEAPPGGD